MTARFQWPINCKQLATILSAFKPKQCFFCDLPTLTARQAIMNLKPLTLSTMIIVVSTLASVAAAATIPNPAGLLPKEVVNGTPGVQAKSKDHKLAAPAGIPFIWTREDDWVRSPSRVESS
ncbi:hypothetical protein EST38_g3666 [Candolleomyces aberdarensis]|uniref:Uncharacterized protein n=1 Tax=Candolleomyces aberdarensis TaxID=2316362 RepID=A0A4Q2DPD6_9AGAR|nr:hypothetical protein EST38_g3666 [Candolleomyces aberdarensis]